MGKTYSRMLDSEGWAMMYGGGFSEIVLYSRVNCSLLTSLPWFKECRTNPLVGSSTGHCEVVAKAAMNTEVFEVEIVIALR